jgi:hypothetical protein
LLFAVDRYLGRDIVRRHGQGMIGADVYEVVNERAKQPDNRVTTLYLGDSVARQFFRAGHEPSPHLRYLTTNQAISLAGQFYLLRDALASFPNARHVRFVYTPKSWTNDLSGPFVHDYFCAFFHRGDEVAEVFRVKRDLTLSAAHAGRWLLPNLMMANSGSNLHMQSGNADWLEPPLLAAPLSTAGSGASGEPLLWAASRLLWKIDPPLAPAQKIDRERVIVSDVSWYFLGRMKDLCRARGIELRVLPGPCVASRALTSGPSPYDAPEWILPAEDFRDGVHIKPALLDAVRQQIMARYDLVED